MTQMRAIYAAYFFVSILFEMVLNAKRPQTASSSESSLELPGSYHGMPSPARPTPAT